MVNIKDIEVNKFIEAVAEELKKNKEITPPEWSGFVKTGVHKERPPVKVDWWYSRLAAILRTVANLGPVGVSKLRTKYGGRKNRGHKPDKFEKGSGSVIRKALQQLESLNYIKQEVVGSHKGRVLTKEGKEFLKKVAETLIDSTPKPVEKKVKAEKKETPAKKAETPKEEAKEEKPKPVEKTETPKESPKEDKEAPAKEEPKAEETETLEKEE